MVARRHLAQQAHPFRACLACCALKLTRLSYSSVAATVPLPYTTPPMKAFNAIIFIFSLATFVLGQQITTTNAYVSHTVPHLLAVNPHQGRVNL